MKLAQTTFQKSVSSMARIVLVVVGLLLLLFWKSADDKSIFGKGSFLIHKAQADVVIPPTSPSGGGGCHGACHGSTPVNQCHTACQHTPSTPSTPSTPVACHIAPPPSGGGGGGCNPCLNPISPIPGNGPGTPPLPLGMNTETPSRIPMENQADSIT